MSQDRGVGDTFQRSTVYSRKETPGRPLDWDNQPETYKSYPGSERIRLLPPALSGGTPIWEVLQARRSVRRYGRPALGLQELSQVLWAGQGITRVRQGVSFRTAPSAGALFPIETYVVCHNVEGVHTGVYHYDVRGHALECVRRGDCRAETRAAALDQPMAGDADVTLLWTAVFGRSKWKYGQRAYRYVYLDAGHIAQNVSLAAVALGLGSCAIAALYDDEANALAGIDGETESTLYMMTLGRLP